MFFGMTMSTGKGPCHIEGREEPIELNNLRSLLKGIQNRHRKDSGMTKLTVRLSTFDDLETEILAKADLAKSGKLTDAAPTLGFETYEDMHRILAPLRLDIVTALTAQGPLAIREVAKRVNRDVQALHRDITTLINSDVLERHEKGVEFPYDGIHFEFDVTFKLAA